MTVPDFIASGPAVYDGATPWPTSLAVIDGAPAGVLAGDRALLLVTTFAIDTATVNVPTPTGWTKVGSRTSLGAHVGMTVFSAQWSTGSGATVSPTITTSASAYSWRLQVAVWRPSKPVRSYDMRDANRFTDNSSFNFPPVASSYGTAGSTAIAVQVSRAGALSGLGPTGSGYGYTLRVDQPLISGRGGALRIADISKTSQFTASGAAWSRQGAPNAYDESIVWSGFLDAPSDDPAFSTGWSVGQIKY